MTTSKHNAQTCHICAARYEYEGTGAALPLGLNHPTHFDFEAFLLTRGFRHADGVFARMPHSGGYTAIYVRGSLFVSITIVTDRTYSYVLPRPRRHFLLNRSASEIGYYQAGVFSGRPDLEWEPLPKDEIEADTVLNLLGQQDRLASLTPSEFRGWGPIKSRSFADFLNKMRFDRVGEDKSEVS